MNELLFELPFAIGLLTALFLGLSVGTFWVRLMARMPFDKSLRGKEICPNCQKGFSYFTLFPVLGLLMMRGKCTCGTPFSRMRWITEILTPVFSVLVFLFVSGFFINGFAPIRVNWNMLTDFLALEWLCLTLIPIFFVDFKYHLIPDSVSIGGIIFGFALSFLPGGITPFYSAVGAIAAGGGLYFFSKIIARILQKNAMGFGDVKLLAAFGAFLGAPIAIEVLIAASFLGVCVIFPIRLFRRQAFTTEEQSNPAEFPFGPFLAIVAPLAYCYGASVLNWYLSLFAV